MASTLPWVEVCHQSPFFQLDTGEAWTPIGHNDAIVWPSLAGCFRQRDMGSVENYLRQISENGVACLRLMLEYSEDDEHYLERPAGCFQPDMAQLWDDLFRLCGQIGVRVLLTPFDTFWMWNRWDHHPYNERNGGPCADRAQWLLCPKTREAIKRRFAFAIERWSGSGVLFAWDLWNEIHPSHAQNGAAAFRDFIFDLSAFVRERERRLYGRAHPQTVSVFGPHMVLDPRIGDCIFRHPSLDIASTHFYEEGTIDYPLNTVDAAVSTGRLMREALVEIRDSRPFFDSEHGPIHSFKDHNVVLPEPYDDEYFRHMQWAHFGSGGAGGGMRWPNRWPHILTDGMHRAQHALSRFLPLIDWRRFQRRNLNASIRSSQGSFAIFGSGDEQQAIVWLLRKDSIGQDGMLDQSAAPVRTVLQVPGLEPGSYTITAWDTNAGREHSRFEAAAQDGDGLCFETPPIRTDLAFAIQQNRGQLAGLKPRAA